MVITKKFNSNCKRGAKMIVPSNKEAGSKPKLAPTKSGWLKRQLCPVEMSNVGCESADCGRLKRPVGG